MKSARNAQGCKLAPQVKRDIVANIFPPAVFWSEGRKWVMLERNGIVHALDDPDKEAVFWPEDYAKYLHHETQTLRKG